MPVKPTYRHLTSEELDGLRNEFIEYLVVNGIEAGEWERLKAEGPEKAEDILTLFSDVVFEGIMRKVRFMDFFSKNEVRTFQCLTEKIVLVGMRTSDRSHDFTNPEFIQKASGSPPDGIEIFTTEKKYTKKREIELFEMSESGCIISDGKLFRALAVSLA